MEKNRFNINIDQLSNINANSSNFDTFLKNTNKCVGKVHVIGYHSYDFFHYNNVHSLDSHHVCRIYDILNNYVVTVRSHYDWKNIEDIYWICNVKQERLPEFLRKELPKRTW